jgi:hypothetical protein
MSLSTTPGPRRLPAQRTSTLRLMAHYADKTDILNALVTGEPATALCGKTWVPSRDPRNYPVCPTCQSAYSDTSRRTPLAAPVLSHWYEPRLRVPISFLPARDITAGDD